MATTYGFGKTVNVSFNEALGRTTNPLQQEGFGTDGSQCQGRGNGF